jgi:type I restriction enzyme R subunit
MPEPREHKTVQARLLPYVQEIGWTYVPRDKAERRGFSPHPNPLPQGERVNTDEARKESLFFGDLIDQLMTAQFRVHGLDLPELKSFTAKGAR